MPKTLLLADDSVTIQKVVGLSFANEDVSLVTVDNGDDAIARARALRPDVVLADVVMPGKNGYEVCEAIKGDPALRHVPVLLLTGTFEAFDEERARRVGADGHITKPFEAQALVDTVNGMLARAAAAPPPAPVTLSPAITAPTVPGAPVAAGPTSAPPTVVAAAPVTPIPVGEESYDFFDDDLSSPAELATETAGEPFAAPGAAQATVLAGADGFDLGGDEAGLELAEVEPDLPAAAPLARAESPDATVAMFTQPPAATAPRPAVSLDEELGALELAEPAAEAVSPDELFDRNGMFEPEVAPAPVAPLPSVPPPAPAVDFADGLDAAFELGLEDAPALPPADTERDPLAGFDSGAMARGASFDAVSSQDFDVSWSDLGRPIGGAELDARLAGADPLDPPDSGVPTVGMLDHTPTAPSAPLGASAPQMPAPARESVQPLAVSAPPLPRSQPIAVETKPAIPSPSFVPSFAPDPGPFVAPEPTPSPAPIASPAPLASPEAVTAPPTPPPAASAASPGPDLSPVLRQRIHDMLEKVAWEAFSDLSDTIVRQALERIEAIAWEVIPQMAEALVREEIRRMKGEGE